VLLPINALLRRADVVEVIGKALAAKAAGAGCRTIAAALRRPVGTVRGWCRRLAGRAEAVRVFFTVLLVEVGPDPVVPAPAGCQPGDPVPAAVSAIVGAAASVAARWPVLGEVSPWEAACAASGGRLLAPRWPAEDDQATRNRGAAHRCCVRSCPMTC
jgi:hypothetical protein